MHTELLQTFVVVVRTGSMTAAALELGVVQSTVSGHLRSLERQFGVKLLDRHPHGVSPTEAGRRLAPIAQDLLDTQARIVGAQRANGERAPAFDGQPVRRLRVQAEQGRADEMAKSVETDHPPSP